MHCSSTDDTQGYIDIHCHQASRQAAIEIVSIDITDFKPDINLPKTFSLGLHPWFIDPYRWQHSLQQLLTLANQTQVIAVGECGLDKAIATSFELQLSAFNQQLRIAEQLNKPVIIHCVRAFNELLTLRKQFTNSRWIIHGFQSSPQQAKQLCDAGCFLAFGKALFNPKSSAKQALLSIPIEQVFLETDVNHSISISHIYQAAAKILAIDVSALQQQQLHNYKSVFT